MTDTDTDTAAGATHQQSHLIYTHAVEEGGSADALLQTLSLVENVSSLSTHLGRAASMRTQTADLRSASTSRLTSKQAYQRADTENRLVVLTEVDQHEYMQAFDTASRTHHTLAHRAALSFGEPVDSYCAIVAALPNRFVVEYSTQLPPRVTSGETCS